MTFEHPAGRALLSIFDRIYVINLVHRKDRRAEMEAQLRRVGLSFDHPQVTLFAASRFEEPGSFPTPGVRGCFMSHLRIQREILRDDLRRVLILEDDANFSKRFDSRIVAMTQSLRARNWSLLYGWHPHRETGADRSEDTEFAPVEAALGVRMSHFMGVNGAASRRIVPYFEAMLTRPLGDPAGGPMHVDGAYSWFRAAHPELLTLAPDAPLALQRPSRSDIHGSKWFDKIEAARPMITALRRVKGVLRAI